MITYVNTIIFCWAAFLVVWGLFAFNVKPDIRKTGFMNTLRRYWILRFAIMVFFAVIAAHITSGNAHYATPLLIFSNGIFSQSLVVGWLAAFLTATGIGLAIWARLYLGRNWSPHPAIKENHELITTGPYAFVRHPIYTGLILAALGAALLGTIFGFIVLFFALVVFTLRIKKEEQIMLQLFPSTYPAYQARTKKLIPFIW